MSLKIELESLEGVEENLHGLYTRDGDSGPYRLNVEGLPDVNGLKSALEVTRGDVKKLKDQLKGFDGVDMDEYHDLQNRKAELEKQDPKKIEDMVNERVSKNDKRWKDRETELMTELGSTRDQLSGLVIDHELRKVGGELGVDGEEAMMDFVSRGKSIFRMGKEGAAVAMKGDDIMYGESGVEPLTMREFGKTLTEKAPHLFKSSGGGGASNEGGSKARGGTVRYKSDLQTPAAKAAYIREHGKNAYLELPASAPAA